MNTSIISIATGFGVVCASNTLKSPMRLSDKLPIIIAFDPNSSINWEMIVNDFRKKETGLDTSEVFANNFVEYIQSLECSKVFCQSESENADNKIIIMGYGKDELYPFAYTYECQCKDNRIVVVQPENKQVVIYERGCDFSCIGSTKYIYPLVPGAFDQYSDCSLVPDLFVNHLYEFCDKNEAFIDKQMNIFPIPSSEHKKRDNLSALLFLTTHPVKSITSHNQPIEVVAAIAEKLVDAEVKIDHLYNGGEKPISTKSIQIITLNEGITSITNS